MFVLGDQAVDDTVYCYLDTFDSSGGSVTITGLAVTDIAIYKDGSITQRASDNGYTLLDTDGIDFDGAVGFHGFSVDLSDNSDASFYAADSHYQILVNAITVDGQTVRFSYSITIGKLLRPTTAGRKFNVTANGTGGVNWADVENPGNETDLTNTLIQTVDGNVNGSVGSVGSTVDANLIQLLGTALTETAGQLAGRFTNFFDQASATFSVATALSSFKATGFATSGALSTHDGKLDTVDGIVDTLKLVLILVDTTVTDTDLTTTTARLTDGSIDDNAYIGMKAVINERQPNGTDLVSRTIIDYEGSTKKVTWTPALSQAPANGDPIYIVPGDTKINVTADANAVELAKIGTIPALDGAAQTIGAAIAKMADDNAGADFDAGTDSQRAIASAVTGAASTGSASNEPVVAEPGGFTLTTGTNEVNDEDSTRALDGTEHTWDDDGGSMDGRYLFNTGGAFVPVSLQIVGRLNGTGGDEVQINVNTGTIASPVFTPATNQRGSIIRTGGATNAVHIIDLFASDIMTGADAGKVQIQITDDGGVTGATFAVDQMFTAKTSVASPTGYSLGACWLDLDDGTAGIVPDINGVGDKPSLTLAESRTIMTAKNLHRLHLAPTASTLTLASNSDGLEFFGIHWTLALAGQSVSNTVVTGAEVSGIGTGASPPHFINSNIGAVTLPSADVHECDLVGRFTLSAAAIYHLGCCSSKSGAIIDFAGVGGSTVYMPGWKGSVLEIQNMGAGDTLYIEGEGVLTINANCTAGTVNIEGNIQLANNGSGQTINQDARVDNPSVADAVADEVITAAEHNIPNSLARKLRQLASVVIANDTAEVSNSPTANQIQLASGESAVDGTFDPGLVGIVGGTGAGQSRRVLEYEGSTRLCTLNRDWKIPPDGTSEYIMMSDPGGLHVNEGLAQGGSSTSITLNSLASSVDNLYNGQFVFLVSGPGQDQVGRVTAYNGTSKVATIMTTLNGWASGQAPTNATGYIMMPILDTVPTLIGTPANTVSDDIAAVKTDTGNLVSRIPAALFSGMTSVAQWLGALAGKQASDATAQTEMRATGAGSGSYLSTTDSNEAARDALTALNDLSAADVNAEVVDALATDTYAEPGQGAPAATLSLAAKIGYLYKNWRNKKRQDATTWELYADDASTVDQKATVSDDGTDATKGEIATGP